MILSCGRMELRSKSGSTFSLLCLSVIRYDLRPKLLQYKALQASILMSPRIRCVLSERSLSRENRHPLALKVTWAVYRATVERYSFLTPNWVENELRPERWSLSTDDHRLQAFELTRCYSGRFVRQ